MERLERKYEEILKKCNQYIGNLFLEYGLEWGEIIVILSRLLNQYSERFLESLRKEKEEEKN